jgi:hypothetical protein
VCFWIFGRIDSVTAITIEPLPDGASDDGMDFDIANHVRDPTPGKRLI